MHIPVFNRLTIRCTAEELKMFLPKNEGSCLNLNDLVPVTLHDDVVKIWGSGSNAEPIPGVLQAVELTPNGVIFRFRTAHAAPLAWFSAVVSAYPQVHMMLFWASRALRAHGRRTYSSPIVMDQCTSGSAELTDNQIAEEFPQLRSTS